MKYIRIALYIVLVALIIDTCIASDVTKYNPAGNNPEITKTFLNISPDDVIFVRGEIRPGGLQRQIDFVKERKKTSIYYIIINTPGGSVDEGMSLIHAIQASKKANKTKAVCLIEGYAFSMGAILASYCHETYINNIMGSMMYHQVAYGIGAQADIVEDFVEYMRKWIKNLETKLSIQIGMSYKEYKILTKKEFWLTARESVIYGFVDGYYDFYFIGEKGFFS